MSTQWIQTQWLSEGNARALETVLQCPNLVRDFHSPCGGIKVAEERINLAEETSISCTTFNILAPIYKRIGDEGCRESQFPDSWMDRNQRILDNLLSNRCSIICLQEVWLGNNDLVNLYDKGLERSGYKTFKLARTNNRGDGLLTALERERLNVLNYKELMFHDCGDRVAQIFHLQFQMQHSAQNKDVKQEFLLVNTHLLFPHDSRFCLVRLWQVYKIIESLENLKVDYGLAELPVILCGDWNGSKRGHVYKFLRSQGFVSSYDVAHSYSDNDTYQWVSHRNHRGNICGVDFIWLRNPGRCQKHLLASWKEAVLDVFKAQLSELGHAVKDESHRPKLEGNWSFVLLLQELCVTGLFSEGLMGALMQISEIDFKFEEGCISDENMYSLSGLSRFKETMRHLSPFSDASNALPAGSFPVNACGERDGLDLQESKEPTNRQTVFGIRSSKLTVQKALLFPPEVEQGIWPDTYSLSDHAPLTVIFSF